MVQTKNFSNLYLNRIKFLDTSAKSSLNLLIYFSFFSHLKIKKMFLKIYIWQSSDLS